MKLYTVYSTNMWSNHYKNINFVYSRTKYVVFWLFVSVEKKFSHLCKSLIARLLTSICLFSLHFYSAFVSLFLSIFFWLHTCLYCYDLSEIKHKKIIDKIHRLNICSLLNQLWQIFLLHKIDCLVLSAATGLFNRLIGSIYFVYFNQSMNMEQYWLIIVINSYVVLWESSAWLCYII